MVERELQAEIASNVVGRMCLCVCVYVCACVCVCVLHTLAQQEENNNNYIRGTNAKGTTEKWHLVVRELIAETVYLFERSVCEYTGVCVCVFGCV